MKKRLFFLRGNQILRGTSIFLIGNVVVSGLAFAYHFVLARLLGPQQYGILAALFGLLYVVGVPMNALDFLVTKLISSFEPGKMISHTVACWFIWVNA